MADRSKSVTDVLDAKTGLKVMKIRSPGKLILGHVNLNSISNKFNSLIYMLDKKHWHLFYFWDGTGWFIPFGPI